MLSFSVNKFLQKHVGRSKESDNSRILSTVGALPSLMTVKEVAIVINDSNNDNKWNM